MIDRIVEINPYAKQMLPDVPVTIMVCFDKNLEKYENRWQMDCANAMLNMLLAAHSLGYGGLWLEIYPVEERIAKFRQGFAIPETVIPFALVAVGHADEKKPAVERYEESRIHYNRWQ
jgi:nitroreductase